MAAKVDETKGYTLQGCLLWIQIKAERHKKYLRKEDRAEFQAKSRDDLTEEILEKDRVCEKHLFPEEQLRTVVNLILTGFHYCFWDTKMLQIEQTIKKRRRNEAR